MAPTPEATTRNPHVVFTNVGHFWEGQIAEKVNRTFVMDAGLSFSSAGMAPYQHINICGARGGSEATALPLFH